MIEEKERFSSLAPPPASGIHVWNGGSGCVLLSLFVVVVSLKCFMWSLFLRHNPPLSRFIMKGWLVPLSEILACSMVPVSIHCFFFPVVSWRITLSPGLTFSELFLPGLLASFVWQQTFWLLP